jgi:CPA2 family monovalent cation:H+ antiporter-2
VIIVGFGLNGSNLAKVLKESDIPHVILEFNSDIVRKMKKRGQPIYYGDGTNLDILRKLRIKAARVLVVAISDASASRRITQLARKENPDLYIIVRTRYLAEMDDLIKLGANEVIPEEFETSVEIFSRVLHHYHVPMNLIIENIENIRKNSYRVLRSVGLPKKLLTERFELLQGIETETYLLKQGSAADGHTLKELNLRTQTGATIMAIQRNDKIYQNPAPDFALKTGDIVLLIGKMKELRRAVEYLESERFDEGGYGAHP